MVKVSKSLYIVITSDWTHDFNNRLGYRLLFSDLWFQGKPHGLVFCHSYTTCNLYNIRVVWFTTFFHFSTCFTFISKKTTAEDAIVYVI